MSRDFLDTNILVYADDKDAGRKQEISLNLLSMGIRTGDGVVSTQVLQEYFSVATRKLGVDAATARRKVELLSRMDVVEIRVAMILDAVDLHRLYGISFWDGLIVAAASVAGCKRLLTEDLQHGRILAGVCIVNPFLENPS